jgi:hypothetical protein
MYDVTSSAYCTYISNCATSQVFVHKAIVLNQQLSIIPHTNFPETPAYHLTLVQPQTQFLTYTEPIAQSKAIAVCAFEEIKLTLYQIS